MFFFSKTTITALLLAAAATIVGTQAGDVEERKLETLYMAEPSCAYYQCHVTWRRESRVQVTWYNAPTGGVKILLVPETDKSLPTYTLTRKIGSVHNKSKCEADAGDNTCGRFYWTVPANAKIGSYSIQAISVKNPSKIGYTDIVDIKAASKRDCDEED